MAQELAPVFALLRGKFQEDPVALHENVRALLRDVAPARGSRFNLDHHDMCLYIKRSKNKNVVVYQAKYKAERSDNLGQGGEAVESGMRADCVLHPTAPLHAMWIKLEPEHVARRRGRGETDDRCELNMVERRMAYGCSATPLSFNAFCESFYAEVSGQVGEKSLKVKKANPKHLTPEQQKAALRCWKAFQPHYVQFVAVPSCPVLLISLKPASAEDAAAPVPGRRTSDKASWFSMEDSIPLMLTVINQSICLFDYIYVASTEPKHFYELPKVDYIDFYGYTLGTAAADALSEEERLGGQLEEERKTGK